jgi:hypothetical protein
MATMTMIRISPRAERMLATMPEVCPEEGGPSHRSEAGFPSHVITSGSGRERKSQVDEGAGDVKLTLIAVAVWAFLALWGVALAKAAAAADRIAGHARAQRRGETTRGAAA